MVVTVALVGWVFNDNGISALTTSLLTAIPLLSLTVLLGYAGQMSLAQVTLSGVGGLIAARLAANAGLPFLVVLPLAMLGTVPVGLIVGLPSARTRGVSLAVATLGLAVAIQALVFTNDSIAGGQAGIALSADGSFKIFGVDFDSFFHAHRFAYLVLGFVLVLAVLVANLRRSASGRRMIAVRGNERAAAGLGINVVTTKLWAFGFAAAITGRRRRAGRLQRADGALHELLGPGQHQRDRLQRRRRGGQRPGRAVRQHARPVGIGSAAAQHALRHRPGDDGADRRRAAARHHHHLA